MNVTRFAPDLENIRAWFDVPKRYYQRNKEMGEACDLLHASISAEDGFTGGIRFEAEYAVSRGIPVLLHWQNKFSEWIFQYSFSFLEENRHFSGRGRGFSVEPISKRKEFDHEMLNTWARGNIRRARITS